MSTCQSCGEEIEWRTIDGRRVPIHPDGGWECSVAALATPERTCWRTNCPNCGATPVFLVRHNGGSVWFDDLGAPWPIHACFIHNQEAIALQGIRSLAKQIGGKSILGSLVLVQRFENQTELAIQLFNGRRACIRVSGLVRDVPGAPLVLYRESSNPNGMMVSEKNVRFQSFASSRPPSWAWRVTGPIANPLGQWKLRSQRPRSLIWNCSGC